MDSPAKIRRLEGASAARQNTGDLRYESSCYADARLADGMPPELLQGEKVSSSELQRKVKAVLETALQPEELALLLPQLGRLEASMLTPTRPVYRYLPRPHTGGPSSATRRQAPEPIRRFWRALLDSEITADSFLVLPSGAYLLGNQERGGALFIRRSYRGLFERMRFLKDSGTNKRFLVTGTPDIGKTCFAVPLMGWLAKEKMASKIVYQHRDMRYLFSTSSGGSDVEEGSTSDFEEELQDPGVWWIVDSGTAVERPANTVLLSYLDRNRYKEFLKLLGATTLYMPVWTDDEIQECRTRLFPRLDPALVAVLQSKWGNIPRYILEKAEDLPSQARLDEALDTCKWDDLQRTIGCPGSGPHACHMLLHLHVVGSEYNQKVIKLASPYVARELEVQAGSAHVQRLVQLSLVCPAITAAAGAFFQSYAHRLLQQGSEFKVRRLGLDDKAQPTTLQLPPAPHTHVFTKLEEVRQQKDGVYCIPSNHNLPAVDALMQPDSLFQMTVTQKVNVNEDDLKAAVLQLRGAKRLMYFVVPTGLFESYKVVNNVSPAIEQWVLEVPWV